MTSDVKRLLPSGRRPVPKDDGVKWDNALFRVGLCTISDDRPWRVSPYSKKTGETLSRYYPSREEAIREAVDRTDRYEKRFYASHPELKPKPIRTGSVNRKKQPKPQIVKEKFSTARFNCIRANPVAQVWLCIKESSNAGRKAKGGRAPLQTMTQHSLLECAVLMGEEPVYDETGRVRVFKHHEEATEFALELYIKAPKTKRFPWVIEHPCVGQVGDLQVLFVPEEHDYRPFKLYIPRLNKDIYYDRSKTMHTASGRSKNSAVQKASKIDSFAEVPLRFRNITAALEEADRRNRMMRGETVLGLNDD